MPNYFNPQQQQPGMFPAVDELESRVHPVSPYVLGVCCAIGGYFYGTTQQEALPVVFFVAVGFVIGVLLVPLFLKTLSVMLAAVIIIIAAVLTFWLLQNDARIKQHQHQPQPPSHETGQALSYSEASRQLLHRLQEVQHD